MGWGDGHEGDVGAESVTTGTKRTGINRKLQLQEGGQGQEPPSASVPSWAFPETVWTSTYKCPEGIRKKIIAIFFAF